MSDQDANEGRGARERHGAGASGPPGEPAAYTVVNLLRAEDMAPRFGLSPSLESRFARMPLGLRASGLSYFRIAPNFRQPFGHRHQALSPWRPRGASPMSTGLPVA
jgi:hypothetical protein